MRIIQITDPHLGEVGEDTFGVDVRANFQHVLEAAIQLHPDHLVLTGDLCFRHGSPEIYAWVKYLLDSLSVPYDLISGNHDDSVQMAKSFGLLEYLHGTELYYLKYFNDIPILFLDTAAGQISLQQKDWLSQQMQRIQQNCIIFMHHPPLLAGVPYMDMNYSLLDGEAIQNIFLKHSRSITIFCGHYHVEKTVQYHNINMHITPSTFYQIEQFSESFQVDHKQPGFRIIDLKNGQIHHTVKYL